MEHLLRCQCGAIQGVVRRSERARRGVCYCLDCQTYAHALGHPGVLDVWGGTDVVAVMPQYISFTRGIEKLACLSLTEQGLLRWYAGCCQTPIGNVLRNYKISYVGLVHNCLENGPTTIDSSFGPVRMVANGKHAKGKTDLMVLSTLMSVIGLAGSLLRARLDGSYKKTPFFEPASGTPIVQPHVLSAAERLRLKNNVKGVE